MSKKTLVLGASENSDRYSNKAIKKLISKNIPVVAIGNRPGKIDHIEITTEVGMINDIDTVTLYLGAKNQPEYFDMITSIQPKRIIFNPGTSNAVLEEIAFKNNIEVVHACTLVMLSTNQY